MNVGAKHTFCSPRPSPSSPSLPTRGDRVTRSQRAARPRFSLRILCVSLSCILLLRMLRNFQTKPTRLFFTDARSCVAVHACRGV